MDNQNIQESLRNAYHSFVAKLYEEFQLGKHKVEDFTKQLHEADKRHAEAVSAVSAGGGSHEADDDYRKRLLPIAGDDTWKARIEGAKGDALDRLGDHYNVKRNAEATVRGQQPQDEADGAERLASHNQAPENGTTADASNKNTGSTVQEPQPGGVSHRALSADDQIQGRIADDTSYERNGEEKG
jgi:hypothetical protein